MSLRARLLLALVPLFVVCLAAADAAVYADQQSFLYGQLEQQAQNGQSWVLSSLGGGPGQPPRAGPGGPGGPGAEPGVVWGEVISSTGGVREGPEFLGFPTQSQLSAVSNHPVLPGDMAARTGEYLTVTGVGTYSGYLVDAQAAPDGSGDLVVAAVPTDSYDATLGNLLRLELLIGAAVVILLIAAAWLIVRRGLRPLEEMEATATAIAAGDLSRRVAHTDRGTEVGRLGSALNAMLSQLEAAFAQRAAIEQRLRQFVADASHELRTPLTSMRGYAELARRRQVADPGALELSLQRIEDEARRMGVLVDDLLLLARLDQGRPLSRAPVDLAALVADACADARAADPERPISARVAAPLTVTGDELRLRQVLANLVRNALVHTPAGTPVEIRLGEEDGWAMLEVIDHGPGIPAAARERVFERFQRADPERSRDQGGSGLGLSIVAAVVTAHGGGVAVADTPGGGTTFRIRLPLG